MGLYRFEQFLNENRSQAEKLLRDKGIPLDSQEYVELKNMLAKDNAIGYLGWLVSIMCKPVQISAGYQNAISIYELVKQNKDLVKQLPYDLFGYKSLYDLRSEFTRLGDLKYIRAMLNAKLYNKTLRKSVIELCEADPHMASDFLKEIKDLEKTGESKTNTFFAKCARFDDAHMVLSYLTDFLSGVDYATVKQKIEKCGKDVVIRLDDEKKEIILVQVLTYAASNRIGSQSWCIQFSKKHWNKYVQIPGNYQYFLFNFNEPSDDRCIGFTMSPDNVITKAHDKSDANIDYRVKEVMDSWGILPKLYEINKRNAAERQHSPRSLEAAFVIPERNNADLHQLIQKSIDSALAVTDDLRGAFYKKENQDLLIKRFLRIKLALIPKRLALKATTGYEYEYNDDDYSLDSENLVNLYETDFKGKQGVETIYYPYLLHFITKEYKYFSMYREGEQYYDRNAITVNLKSFVKSLTEFYSRQRSHLDQETILGIMQILKKENVDILRLSMDAKNKAGENHDATEFSFAAKRGDNLKPHIQNKIAQSRRGDAVDFTPAEVRYGIENGHKTFFQRAYEKVLDDPFETIDYDDLAIIKLLGLEDKMYAMMLRKGNELGEDQLNSIELSLYQYAKRKALN